MKQDEPGLRAGRRGGEDRRSGLDTRSEDEKRRVGERRMGDRRSGVDRRAQPRAPESAAHAGDRRDR